MEHIFDLFVNESAYPDLDGAGAVERLSQALRFVTVTDAPAPGAFEGLRAHMRASFPRIMAAAASFETFRNSVLITIPGTDPALKGALFMSHQDVVPVVPGTEGDWLHGPFSGDVAEGYIWGRGAEDIKQQVFGTMEALEYLLAHGFTPARTVYLAFGDDEETLNTGSRMMAEALKARGVELEFLLDEGGGKVHDAAAFGAPGVLYSDINLMEKGYADLELTVESHGGHSSRPFGGSSLGILSEAIAAITTHPFPAEMDPLLRRAFTELGDAITDERVRALLDREDWDGLAQYALGQRELFPYVTTTIAPTMIEGGSLAANVLPQNLRAVINFRLAAGTTPDRVLAHCREQVGDERVGLRFLQANPPSKISEAESFGYESLVQSMERFYQGVRFIPLASAGATDARSYEDICPVCLRCSPFLLPKEDEGGVHGTNERLLVRAYLHGIRVLIDLMERTLG